MANLKEIRTRIASVKSTRQITSAMKMVAAAKLKKAQNAITQIRPYADKLYEILNNLSKSLDNSEDNPYAEQREVKKVLLVAITSNKGLCGAFNNNVVKKTIEAATTKYKSQYENGNLDIINIGKKAADLLKSRKFFSLKEYNDIYNNLSFESTSELSELLMKQFTVKKYDKIELIYNKFKNAASQTIMLEQFLPVLVEKTDEKTKSVDYIFEPSKFFIVNKLIPDSLKIQFFKAILDSNASEQGARMTAMHKATDNASDLISELQLNYNKARQAAITNEILEIVGGAEALNG